MCKLILILLMAMVMTVAGAQASSTRLAALGMLESGDNDTAVGAVGEVSRYQIKPWIWRQYSTCEEYQNRELSTQVAGQHLAELQRVFRKRTRREPDDFDLYVLWNAGPTYYGRIGFAQARVHPVVRERARRYANLREAMDVQLAKVQPARTTAPIRPTKASPKREIAPAPPAQPESLLPLFAVPHASSLQSPLFSIVPLTAQPQTPLVNQKPVLAVGGLKVK
jgi:hypothetical protein